MTRSLLCSNPIPTDNARACNRAPLEAIATKHCANKVDAIDAVRRYAVTIGRDAGDLMLNSTEQLRMQFRKQSLAHWS